MFCYSNVVSDTLLMEGLLMKKVFIVIILVILCTSCFGETYSARFKDIYPKPFFETTAFKIGEVAATAVVTGVITYVTAGSGAVSAGPISKVVGSFIGRLVGGYHGIAGTSYGLAFLGGGAVSQGGLGIAGGVAVINTLGDLGVSISLNYTLSKLNEDLTKYSLIKLDIPTIGSKEVKKQVKIYLSNKKKLDDIKSMDSFEEVNKLYNNYYNLILNECNGNLNNPENQLVKAIILYNNTDYDKSEEILNSILQLYENKAFIYYMKSLIFLTKGDYSNAEKNLIASLVNDSDDIRPYLLLSQVYLDSENYTQSLKIIDEGLDTADNDDFALLSMAGNISYRISNYDQAIKYLKRAIKNVNVDEYQAQAQVLISYAYFKLGDLVNSKKWIKKATEKLYDNGDLEYSNKIMEDYTDFVKAIS